MKRFLLLNSDKATTGTISNYLNNKQIKRPFTSFKPQEKKQQGDFAMIAKTTLCLIVITTMCRTAIQFARGDDCCNCNQNTDHSYIGRLSALIIRLSRRVYNSSFENLEEVQRGGR